MNEPPPEAARPVVHLLRHGETDWNVARRMQGHQDVPLNEAGRGQALASARRLASVSPARLVSSDLARARATADAVGRALGLAATLDPRWREQSLGAWEGLTFGQARAQDPDLAERFAARDPSVRPPGGETRAETSARAWAALEDHAAAGTSGPLLVVTHGGIVQAVLYRVLGLAADAPRRFLLPNAGITTLVHRRGVWYVRTMSDTSHLPFEDDDTFPFA